MKIMFSHIILYMKFTQFIKEFRSAHPDLNMSFKECMQSDDIKGAYKDIIGAGLAKKPAKIAEPKKVQEVLGKEAAVGEWKKPPEERGIKGGTKAKRSKDCPPCPPCDRRRCVGDKGKRGGGQQREKEYKLKGKENIQIIINNAAPSEGESKPPVTPGVLPMKQEAPFKPFSSNPEEQNRIQRHLGNNRPGGGGGGEDDDDDGDDSGNNVGDDSGNNVGDEYGQTESKEDESGSTIPPTPNPIFKNDEYKFRLPAQTTGGVNWEDTISADEFPPAPDLYSGAEPQPQQFYPAHKYRPPLSSADEQRFEQQYWAHKLPLLTHDINGIPYVPRVAQLPNIPNINTTYPIPDQTVTNQTDIPVRKPKTTPNRGNYTDKRGVSQGVLDKSREKPVVKQTDPSRTDLPVDQPYEQDDEEDHATAYTYQPYSPYQYPFTPVQPVQHVVPHSVHFNPNPRWLGPHEYWAPVRDNFHIAQTWLPLNSIQQPPTVAPQIAPQTVAPPTVPMDVVGPNDPAKEEKKKVSRANRQSVKPSRKQVLPIKPKTVPMVVEEPVNTQESTPADKPDEPFRSPDGRVSRSRKVVAEDVPAIAKPDRNKRSEDKMVAPDPINDKKRKGPSAPRNKLPTMEVQNLLMPMRRRTDPSSSTDDPSSSINMLHEPSPKLPVRAPSPEVKVRALKEKLPFTSQAHVEGPPKRRATAMPFGEDKPRSVPASVPVPAPRSRTPAKRVRAVDEEQPAPVPAPRSRTVADVPVQRQEATPEQYRDAAEGIVKINYMMKPADAEDEGTWLAESNRSANETAMRLLTQQAGPIYNLKALGNAVRRALIASGRESVRVDSSISKGFYVGRGLRS